MGFVQRFLSRMGDVWAKGRVQEDDCVYSPRLGDLPQDLVAVVLSLTTPKDIARLACVSRVCRDASKADFVWLKMLPPRYADILGQTPEDAPSSTSSKKDVFNYLATGRILLENGTEVWFKLASSSSRVTIRSAPVPNLLSVKAEWATRFMNF